jgi:hypothetical protein
LDAVDGADGEGPRAVLRSAVALGRLQWLRAQLWAIESRSGLPQRLGALDEVVPLLGDRGSSGFELAVERLRYAAHTLTYPENCSHHLPLVALSRLGSVVSGAAGQLVDRYADVLHPPQRATFTQASTAAGRAGVVWRAVDARLRPLRSVGLDGRHAAEAADQVRRGVEAQLAASGTVTRLPAGLADVRRVVLLLPELAGVLEHVCGDLARQGALTAVVGGSAAAGADALVGACAEAVIASQRLVKDCAELPGAQPLPGRAQLVSDPTFRTLVTASRARQPLPAPAAPSGRLIWLQDPEFGVLSCDARLFEQALRHSDSRLRDLVRPHTLRLNLTGRESRPTLAVLAARLAPDRLVALDAAASGPFPRAVDPASPDMGTTLETDGGPGL